MKRLGSTVARAPWAEAASYARCEAWLAVSRHGGCDMETTVKDDKNKQTIMDNMEIYHIETAEYSRIFCVMRRFGHSRRYVKDQFISNEKICTQCI